MRSKESPLRWTEKRLNKSEDIPYHSIDNLTSILNQGDLIKFDMFCWILTDQFTIKWYFRTKNRKVSRESRLTNFVTLLFNERCQPAYLRFPQNLGKSWSNLEVYFHVRGVLYVILLSWSEINFLLWRGWRGDGRKIFVFILPELVSDLVVQFRGGW